MKRIVIIGTCGSGKTILGRELAKTTTHLTWIRLRDVNLSSQQFLAQRASEAKSDIFE